MRNVGLALVVASCGSPDECGQSADCPAAGEISGVCLEDLQRGERYCTTSCHPTASPFADECPPGRVCGITDVRDTTGFCLERVGSCDEVEHCGNGLDDDCDGTTDAAPCEPIVCYTDFMCGEVRDHACVRQGDTRACGAILRERNVGAPCSDPTGCYNGHCSYGYCGEACGPIGAPCGDGWCLPDESDLLVCVRDCQLGCREGQECFGFLIYCGDPDDPSCFVTGCARL
jgi:hypothetical protein